MNALDHMINVDTLS